MRQKLLYAFTAPQSAAAFLRGQADFMAARGYEVHVASSPGPGLQFCRDNYAVRTHEIHMDRDISPARDALSLFHWFRLISSTKPEIVNYGTPKASLLCSVAAFCLRVPKRVYIVRGLRYESESGAKRLMLKTVERLITSLSTDVIAVSRSLGQAMRDDGISNREIKLIGSGSSNGIAYNEWAQNIGRVDAKETKSDLGIPPECLIVLFVGRVTEDKGLRALLELKGEVLKNPNVSLLIVGPKESDAAASLSHDPDSRTFVLGPKANVSPYYAIADVLVLPTKREGFPNVVLEAAVAQVPTVTMNVTGAKDSVVDGETGYVVPADDATAMTRAVFTLLESAALRRQMGEASNVRARDHFDQFTIWEGLEATYRSANHFNIHSI